MDLKPLCWYGIIAFIAGVAFLLIAGIGGFIDNTHREIMPGPELSENWCRAIYIKDADSNQKSLCGKYQSELTSQRLFDRIIWPDRLSLVEVKCAEKICDCTVKLNGYSTFCELRKNHG